MPVKKEKTQFTVKLTELKAADKVKLIKEVKNCIQGLNLVQVRVINVCLFYCLKVFTSIFLCERLFGVWSAVKKMSKLLVDDHKAEQLVVAFCRFA